MTTYEFKNAAISHGIHIVGDIIADGKLHRCPIEGHKSGTKNGAYILHLDGNPAGWAMDYKTGNAFTWRQDGQRVKLSKADWLAIEAANKARQKERDDLQQATAIKAASIWQSAPLADSSNAYLTRKKIPPYGTKRGYNGALIVPLYNATLKLVNLQFIQTDGAKRFMTGGQKKHCFWWIGKKSSQIAICEGFSTAASVHQATGLQTFIAFDAGNLANVAMIVRAKNRQSEIIICGDNDESGVGQNAAYEAALVCGGKYLIPEITGMDFNDMTCGAAI